jgi:hypothetical protein
MWIVSYKWHISPYFQVKVAGCRTMRMRIRNICLSGFKKHIQHLARDLNIHRRKDVRCYKFSLLQTTNSYLGMTTVESYTDKINVAVD